MRALQLRFCDTPEFSAIVLQIQAILPRLGTDQAEGLDIQSAARPPTRMERFFSRSRRSTDEIFDDIAGTVSLNFEFLLNTVLSALIAALGMRSGQVAIVVGQWSLPRSCLRH